MMTMNQEHFNPLKVSRSILIPIRALFTHYAPDHLKYNKDPSETKILIDTANNFHGVKIETQPRILINRGAYMVASRSIDEDLAVSKSAFETKGLLDKKSLSFIQGQATITIEARDEGVCELITNMVSSYLHMASHLIAREYGFTSFARPMNVGSCAPFQDAEQDTSFRVVITLPYETQDMWRIRQDAIKIKEIDLQVSES